MIPALVSVVLSLLDQLTDSLCEKHETKKVRILRIIARVIAIATISFLYLNNF
jgi:hypothetical protein